MQEFRVTEERKFAILFAATILAARLSAIFGESGDSNNHGRDYSIWPFLMQATSGNLRGT